MDSVYKLIELAQKGDITAKEQLIKENSGLIWSVARRFFGRGTEADDVYQLACLGFLKAVDGFDLAYGTQFSTYAVPMILGEIKRYIRDDGNIKVSRQLKTDMRRLRQIKDEYYNRTGSWPKLSYMAQAMELPVEKILEIMDAADRLSSIESFDNEVFMQGYQEKKVNRVSEEDKNVSMIDLKNSIGLLPERERQIIVLRYFKDMTQQQVADRLGISQVQVSRIEKRVLAGMREEIE